MSRLIIAAKNSAIVAGDDVARAGAGKTLEKLVERIGASVWFEGLRGRNSFPTDHPAYRGTLAFDAPGVAKQFADNDLVLLVGGPFFEEVWYGPGSPFPAGITVIEYLTNLDAIGTPRCRFMALPLRIEGADGSPVRAVAFVE